MESVGPQFPGTATGTGAGPGPDDPTVVLPATIGPYVVMRPLGGGGMGVVTLCRTASGRLVAVKQVREEYADDPDFRSRFRREVAAARRVSGVYTVPVVDADTDAHQPWVASAYVPGPTLDQAVRLCGSFQEPALRALGTGLAEALQAVHAAGLVHRDLKPGNVLLAADGPRVIDFGISRALGETRLTGTGTVIGSPAFMAPEQITSFHDVGPAGDVFSLAGLIVYAACGEGPFGLGDDGALHRVVTAEPDLSGVPAALQPLLQRCLDKTPSRRPVLADVLAALAPANPADLLLPALRDDLAVRSRDAEMMAVAPPPPGLAPGERRKEPPSRRGLLIGGLSVVGALAAGGAFLALKGGDDDNGVTTAKNPGSGKPLSSAVRTVQLTAPPAPLWTAQGPATSLLPDLRAIGAAVVLRTGTYTAAYDAATGAVRWGQGTRADGQPASSNDPLDRWTSLLGLTDTRIVAWRMATDTSSGVHRLLEDLDPATARVRGAAVLPSMSTNLSGILTDYGSTLYCTLNTLKGSIIPSTPGGTADYKVAETAAAIDLGSGTTGSGGGIRWQVPIAPNSQSMVSYAADRHGFYYTEDTDAGLTVHALDAARGTSRWSVKVPADPDSSLPSYLQGISGQLSSSLTAAGDLLITVNLKGGMTAYDAGSGKHRWTVPLSGAASPIVAGNLLLTHDTSRVQAIDLRTGTVKWRVASPVQLSAYGLMGRTLAASEQVTAVLFGNLALSASGASTTGGMAGCLVLRTSDGKQLWALRKTLPTEPAVPASPTAIGGGSSTSLDMESVAVRGSTVFFSGSGKVRAYPADAR